MWAKKDQLLINEQNVSLFLTGSVEHIVILNDTKMFFAFSG